MIDFKVGDYVVLLSDPTKKGIVTRVLEQYWDNISHPLNRLPENYEISWEDKSVSIESQWTIDPCPFEPNDILKVLIT